MDFDSRKNALKKSLKEKGEQAEERQRILNEEINNVIDTVVNDSDTEEKSIVDNDDIEEESIVDNDDIEEESLVNNDGDENYDGFDDINDYNFNEENSSDNSNSCSDGNEKKGKLPIKFNKGILFIIAIMVSAIVFIGPHYLNSNKDAVIETKSDTKNSAVIETKSDTKDSTVLEVNSDNQKEKIQSIEIVDESIDENDKPMEGKHLTGIPVVVTEEVDEYFKESVALLKDALAIDSYIANNNVYGDDDAKNEFNTKLNSFNDSIEIYKNNHKVPKGCDEYETLVNKSLDAYSFYFNSVVQAFELNDYDSFKDALNSAVIKIQEDMSDLSSIGNTWQPVFMYYGLFN